MSLLPSFCEISSRPPKFPNKTALYRPGYSGIIRDEAAIGILSTDFMFSVVWDKTRTETFWSSMVLVRGLSKIHAAAERMTFDVEQ